jgi:hypothetical protein
MKRTFPIPMREARAKAASGVRSTTPGAISPEY